MTRHPSYQVLQKALVKARRSKGLTQAQIATRLGKPQSFVSKYESGERRVDVVEFLEICRTLSVNPNSILNKADLNTVEGESILRRWEISEQDLTELVDQNPSLRGMLLGYVAEKKFHDLFLDHPGVTEKAKDDDHDRTRKGDHRIVYNGKTYVIEVKSLQTNMVKSVGKDRWIGKSQVDASDSREISFPNGSKLKTTCLLRGEFDILAVNCFAFGNKWRFAFAMNSELPQNTYKKYTKYQRSFLLPTLIHLKWPLEPPFTEDFFKLLDTARG